jgi:hypothetical protein
LSEKALALPALRNDTVCVCAGVKLVACDVVKVVELFSILGVILGNLG